MARLVHSMVRVLDLARSIDFYRTALELEPAERFDFETFTLLYLRNAESTFELELTWNRHTDTPLTLGNGYGHLAATVADAAAEHARVTAAGLAPEPVKELHHEGSLVGRYFFLTDPDGYRIEILERAGRFA